MFGQKSVGVTQGVVFGVAVASPPSSLHVRELPVNWALECPWVDPLGEVDRLVSLGGPGSKLFRGP